MPLTLLDRLNVAREEICSSEREYFTSLELLDEVGVSLAACNAKCFVQRMKECEKFPQPVLDFLW